MDTISPSSRRGRIAPVVSADTEFFWTALSENRLVIQRCSACRELRNPPGPICPNCLSLDWQADEMSGRGTVFSYMIQHHPKVPGFVEPTVVAVIDLDEGPRILSNIVDVEPAQLRIGAAVVVGFVDQDEGWTAHEFRVVAR